MWSPFPLPSSSPVSPDVFSFGEFPSLSLRCAVLPSFGGPFLFLESVPRVKYFRQPCPPPNSSLLFCNLFPLYRTFAPAMQDQMLACFSFFMILSFIDDHISPSLLLFAPLAPPSPPRSLCFAYIIFWFYTLNVASLVELFDGTFPVPIFWWPATPIPSSLFFPPLVTFPAKLLPFPTFM